MALSNIAEAGQQGMGSTCRVQSFARITLDLDDDYPTGGYPDGGGFTALVKTALGNQNITVVDVKRANAGGGYQYVYDRVNDTLMVYLYPTSAGPMTQVPDETDLVAITGVELIVYWV
jgi:hypothetical protein